MAMATAVRLGGEAATMSNIPQTGLRHLELLSLLQIRRHWTVPRRQKAALSSAAEGRAVVGGEIRTGIIDSGRPTLIASSLCHCGDRLLVDDRLGDSVHHEIELVGRNAQRANWIANEIPTLPSLRSRLEPEGTSSPGDWPWASRRPQVPADPTGTPAGWRRSIVTAVGTTPVSALSGSMMTTFAEGGSGP